MPFETEVEAPRRATACAKSGSVAATPAAGANARPGTGFHAAADFNCSSAPGGNSGCAPVVSRPKVSHVRIDQPKRVWRLSPIFRRWAAEEFSGELDDHVNPRWLLNGDAEVRIEPLAAGQEA